MGYRQRRPVPSSNLKNENKLMTTCIACGGGRIGDFLDLGTTALANKFLAPEDLSANEPQFPLVVGSCLDCGHVQLTYRVPPAEMFDDYLYISSLSSTLVNHLRDLAKVIAEREKLGKDDLVVDIGCNDGTLLAGFKALGVRTLGVDPARNLQALAAKNGIESMVAYFGRSVAEEIVTAKGRASAMTATNVFPHIPDLSDVLAGADILLKPGGVFVLEAHYLGDLIERCAFDTVYHEHVSFWSLKSAITLFRRFGFEVVDIARLPIHHGQLRLFVRRKGEGKIAPTVAELLDWENRTGLTSFANLKAFAAKVQAIKTKLHSVLAQLKGKGLTVVGYGAPAKGSTLIAFLGLGAETIPWIADKSPLKQGRFTPGAHIPIVSPARIETDKPDYMLLLAWNFAEEIMEEQRAFRARGGRFILPVPDVEIV